MNEQAIKFRVGLFVLAALLLLAVLVTLFGGLPTFLRRHTVHTVVFQNAPGVTPGTPVRRSGVRIGEVRSVELDDATGLVRVRLLIERPHPMYRSDQAILVHGLLGGDTSIDLVARRPDGQPAELVAAEPGTEFQGINQAEMATLLDRAAGMVPDAQEALKDIRATLQRFEKLIPAAEEALKEYRELGRIARESVPDLRRTNDEIQNTARTFGRLGERLDVLVQTNEEKVVKAVDTFNDTLQRVNQLLSDDNQRNLAATLKNVREGSERLGDLTRNADELLREGQKTVRRLGESVTQAEEILQNLQQGTKPFAEKAPAVMQNLDEGTARFNQAAAQVLELLRLLGQGDGSLRRFLNDPTLYQNLSDAASMVVRIMPRLDRILKDVEIFADKIARHPESLGIGGVVNPSSGLKNLPPSHHSFRPGPGGH